MTLEEAMDLVKDQQRIKGIAVKDAQQSLGGVSNVTVYRLIDSGDLRSYKIGRRRFIYLDSINDYIDRQLAVQEA